jgi:uncharacterized protein involved in type VI secretion and phage assembly
VKTPTQGLVVGKVCEVNDPEGHARIKVRFPHMGNTQSEWSTVASIMAGGDRGCFFMPEIDDEVLLGFRHGDWDHPYIIGFVWNPVQPPPSADPRERMIRSKNGHTIRFIDSTENNGNKGGIVIEDAHGTAIALTNGLVRIKSEMAVEIDAKSVRIMGRPVKPLGGPI